MIDLKYIPGDLVHVKKAALHFQNEYVPFKVISSLSGGILKVVIPKSDGSVYNITDCIDKVKKNNSTYETKII